MIDQVLLNLIVARDQSSTTPRPIQRVLRFGGLCARDDRHYSKTCRAVQLLLAEFMKTVNAGEISNSDLTVVEFWEKTYLPFAVENLRHSTVYGYKQIWSRHLAEHFGTVTLAEYKTHMGSKFLTALSKTLRPVTLQHIKSLASGIFSHAVNSEGLIDANPWHDVQILGKTIAPKETPHYSLGEVKGMLSALSGHADCQAALALACLVGLRPSEIQGLRWDDIEDGWVHIRRGIVRGHEGPLKTDGSAESLPLVAPVVRALEVWKQQSPDPERVFRRDLRTLVDTIRPILAAHGLEWRGLYAGRRGVATILTELTGNALAAQAFLRHQIYPSRQPTT